MVSSTSAGTIIAISAAAPATFDSTGYAALTYTAVGGVESIPAFGANIAVNQFQPLNGPQDKHKGPVNYGSLQVPMALDDSDAGQTLLKTAAAPGNNALYSFKVTYPNASVRYFQGRVFGFQETPGSASNVLMANTTIEITTAIIKTP